MIFFNFQELWETVNNIKKNNFQGAVVISARVSFEDSASKVWHCRAI